MRNKTKAKAVTLLSSVRQHGFCLRPIPSSTALQLEQALLLFSRDHTFRFPPPEGFPYPEWPCVYKESYQNLIATAKECFKELLIELKECTTISTSQTDRDRARHILALHDQLDYSQSSFMNLFNYQYGHLAPHRDRCLVTIVFTLPPHAQPPSRRDDACATPPRHSTIKNSSYKNLWCLAPQQEENSSDIHSWTSIDALVAKPGSQHSVCLHVGEELRTLYNGQIPAALHCVQADPTTSATTTAPVTTEQQQKGKEKVVQHEQRLMLATNNRLSAALILSSAEISAIVEEVLSETKPL